MQITILQPKTERQMQDYYDLRWRVLRSPHGQPRGSEKDDLEELSIHLIAYYDKDIPAAVRKSPFQLSKGSTGKVYGSGSPLPESGHRRLSPGR